MNYELFKRDVEKAVRLAIANLDAGTVGVSADCLWQLTRIPSNNGPSGTNAPWVARQAFNEVISRKPYSRIILNS
jgi:hypothetical protein